MSVVLSTTRDLVDSLSLFKHAYEQVVRGAEVEFDNHPAVKMQSQLGVALENPHIEYARKVRDQKISQARDWYKEQRELLYGQFSTYP